MNIKELREKTGLTQQEVAEQCGLSLSAYQNYEAGIDKIDEAKYSVVIKLSKILGISHQSLLSENYKIGDKQKRNLDYLIYWNLMDREIAINTKGASIESKENTAKKILNKLLGVDDLGKIEVHESNKPYEPSYCICHIPVVDFNIIVSVEIKTNEVNVSAKYVGNQKDEYVKQLFSYGGELADSFIDCAQDKELDRFSNFLVLKTIEYINYLSVEKNIKFEILKDQIGTIYSSRKITDIGNNLNK